MIKHFLGNSKINSMPEWRVFLLTNAKVYAYNNLREQILFIQFAKLKKFSTLKNSACPLTQSIKVHRRALVLLPCLILCHCCEKSARNLATLTIFDHATCQHTPAREPTTRAWSSANIWRQDGAICSKNRKIVQYYGSAWIPRRTVSSSVDYGSCHYPIHCPLPRSPAFGLG